MANINGLQMGDVLSTDLRISIKKSLFSKKAVYNPTNSTIKCDKKEYSAEVGSKIAQFLRGNSSDIVARAQNVEHFQESSLGNYLLELAVSDDHQFAAICLYQFDQLRYKAITEILYFEGEEAKVIAEKF